MFVVASVGLLCTSREVRATSTSNEQPPTQAALVGYTRNTYLSEFRENTIDLANKGSVEFQWYPWRFFHENPPSPSGIVLNMDGSITLGAKNRMSIATAAPSYRPSKWVGVAFGGGGYFEAEIKFDPRDTFRAGAHEWPSFWSMSVEHLAGLTNEQWEGQTTGYCHFIEPDFFEYDVWTFASPTSYGGAIHDWYGIYKQTCPGRHFCNVLNESNFVIETPKNTSFTNYHKFGFLWVTASDSHPGYAQYYFDDHKTTDTVIWTKFRGEAPRPDKKPWAFGVIDQQHLVLILESGAGQPMTVRSVRVWQASEAANLRP